MKEPVWGVLIICKPPLAKLWTVEKALETVIAMGVVTGGHSIRISDGIF